VPLTLSAKVVSISASSISRNFARRMGGAGGIEQELHAAEGGE
jgi:hypothetical protein